MMKASVIEHSVEPSWHSKFKKVTDDKFKIAQIHFKYLRPPGVGDEIHGHDVVTGAAKKRRIDAGPGTQIKDADGLALEKRGEGCTEIGGKAPHACVYGPDIGLLSVQTVESRLQSLRVNLLVRHGIGPSAVSGLRHGHVSVCRGLPADEPREDF